MAYEKKPLLCVGGLWEKESAGAGGFLSGKIGKLPEGVEIRAGDKMWVFNNKKPRQQNSPTHFLMIEDPRKQGEAESRYKTKPPADGGGFEGFGEKGDADEDGPF